MINFENVQTSRDHSANHVPKTTHEFYKPEKFKKEVHLPNVKNKKKETNVNDHSERIEDREPKM